MEQVLNEIIQKLLKQGLEISMSWDEVQQTVMFDLNTQMKSHCYVRYLKDTDQIVAEGRYGKEEVIENYQDLLSFVKECMCGRDFMNNTWCKILEENHE